MGASCYALPVAVKHVSDKADLIFPHPKHGIRDYCVKQSGNYKLTHNYSCMEHPATHARSSALDDFAWFTAQITV